MVVKQAFITGGQQLSAAVDITGLNPVGLIIAGNWTAANVTFQVSLNGSDWFNLYDNSGNEVTITTGGAGRAYVGLTNLAPFNHIKVRSGTSGSPAVQAGDQPIQLLCEEEE